MCSCYGQKQIVNLYRVSPTARYKVQIRGLSSPFLLFFICALLVAGSKKKKKKKGIVKFLPWRSFSTEFCMFGKRVSSYSALSDVILRGLEIEIDCAVITVTCAALFWPTSGRFPRLLRPNTVENITENIDPPPPSRRWLIVSDDRENRNARLATTEFPIAKHACPSLIESLLHRRNPLCHNYIYSVPISFVRADETAEKIAGERFRE